MMTHTLGRKYDLIDVRRAERRRVRADKPSNTRRGTTRPPRAQTSDTIHHGSKFDHEQVTGIIEGIRNEGLDTIRAKASETFPDPDDRVFYEVALAEPDSRLVTGNLKHYPTSPIVVTPAQFCNLLGL